MTEMNLRPPKHLTKSECDAWRDIVANAPAAALRPADRVLLELSSVLLADSRAKKARFTKHLALIRALDRLGMTPAANAELLAPKRGGGRPRATPRSPEDAARLAAFIALREDD